MPLSESLVRSVAKRYRIEREIGRGGMATVYLAHDLKHGRQVAIKVMDRAVAAAIGPERFRREIEIAARLSHPHILPLFDSGAADGTAYYVMPYVEGETLRDRLTREGKLPVEDALRLTREIASALGHAHHRGLVHRDIKPDNVLLSDGIARVADFGIAHASSAWTGDEPGAEGRDETTAWRTGPGVMVGTPRYMAPEQFFAGAEVDARADLYSLGCVLYEMLSGKPPFAGPIRGLAQQHATATPKPVTEHRPDVPAAVVAVIAKVLSKSPDDRYATAARFAEALEAAAAGTTPLPETGDAGAGRHNLPRDRTRFIGREKEIEECTKLLRETPLLTIAGIGGCGKTRLATQVAARLLAEYPDGVWFVDLAPVSEPERVAELVAVPLGILEHPGTDLADALCRHVRGKALLLVLDNCEHLLPACIDLIERLLREGDSLRIIATSRDWFDIVGERLVALRPLSVPPADRASGLREIASTEAVQLFVDRVRAVAPGFALTPENAPAVAEVCRRLDGIPLAIELAAARARILSVEQIRTRLDDRFRLLSGGSKAALPRHQTLRATIQWSYDHLAPEEQRLFRCFSVFVGGWSLESATHVAGEGVDEFEIMDHLLRLADKSLILVDRDRDLGSRYRMLETVRQFGVEALVEAGEGELARDRHSREFQSLAERAYAERVHREESWAAALEAEHDNLRAALESVRDIDPERYMELAGALAWFWQVRSHFVEGREQLDAALAASPSEPVRPTRARALWGHANLLAWQGDPINARMRMAEALRMWRNLGQKQEVALALEGIGWAEILAGEEESARKTLEECLRLQRDLGDPVRINRAQVALGQTLVALGDIPAARPIAEEIVAFSRARSDRRNEHFGLHYLADCELMEGRFEESLARYRVSLALIHTIGDRLETSFEVQGVAMSLAGLGRASDALCLAAAAAAEQERIGAEVHMTFWDALLERHLGAARRSLGAEAAGRVEAEGRLLPFESAVAQALATEGNS